MTGRRLSFTVRSAAVVALIVVALYGTRTAFAQKDQVPLPPEIAEPLAQGLAASKRGEITEAHAKMKAALKAAQATKDSFTLARVEVAIGMDFQKHKKYKESLLFGEDALPRLRAAGYVVGQVLTQWMIGIDYSGIGDGEKAEQSFRACLTDLDELQDESAEANLLTSSGISLMQNHRFDGAAFFLTKAIELSKSAGDRESEVMALTMLASLDNRTFKTEAARPLVQRAVQIAEETRSPVSLTFAYEASAETEINDNHAEAGINFAQKALNAVEDKTGIEAAAAKLYLGTGLAMQGKYARSLELIDAAWPVIKTGGEPFSLALLSFVKALDLGGLHRPKEALPYCNSALALFQAQGDKPRIAILLMIQGECLYETGQKAQAKAAFKQALTLADSLNLTKVKTLVTKRLALFNN